MPSIVFNALNTAKLPQVARTDQPAAQEKHGNPKPDAKQVASNTPDAQAGNYQTKVEGSDFQAQVALWPLSADMRAMLLRNHGNNQVEIEVSEEKVILKGALESIKDILANKDFLAQASAKYAKLIHVQMEIEDSPLYNDRKMHFIFDNERNIFVLTASNNDHSVFWEYFSDMDDRTNTVFHAGLISQEDPVPQPVFVWNDIRRTHKTGPEPTNHTLLESYTPPQEIPPEDPTPPQTGEQIPPATDPVIVIVDPPVPSTPKPKPSPPPNNAPIASTIADQVAGNGTAFALDVSGNFTDADMQTLMYSAVLQGGGSLPAWLGFSTLTAQFSGTPAIGDIGAVTIIVTANDGKAIATASFVLRTYAQLGTSMNDILVGSSIYGGPGDDQLTGTAGNDSLSGADGLDTIQGGDGNDVIEGGNGNDTLYGQAGNDTVYGGADDDFMLGDDGDDKVYGEAGNDTLYGWNGNDTLEGGDGNDLLSGEANNDSLIGGAGIDSLYGGNNEDTLYGGDDDDFLYGDAGYDLLDGEAGNDYLDAGSENDTLYGGAGADTLLGGTNEDTLYGGDDDDFLYGNAGYDYLAGEAGNDYLDAGSENDTLYGGAGTDTLYGGTNEDTLYGGDDDDFLYGNAGYDWLSGDAGNDYLDADSENDTLYGGAGADTLLGGANEDTLYGGDGDDYYTGGTGFDRFVIDHDNADGDNDHITDMTSGDDKLAFSNTYYTFTGIFSAVGFAGGSFAGSGGATFLYDTADGQVWYDADADGAGAAVLIATIDNFAGYVFDSADFMAW